MGKFIVMPPPGVQPEIDQDGIPVFRDVRHATHWLVVNKLTNEIAGYYETEDEANQASADLDRD